MNWLAQLRLLHRAWRYALRTERDEIAVVLAAIRAGDCVLDIGAHKGAFTYWMARQAGSAGKVLAFEPIPELAEYMRSVRAAFGGDRIEVFQCGLSDADGQATLYFPGRHLGCASIEIAHDVMRPHVEITTAKLDSLLAERGWDRPIAFIKCDVEHHELAVFIGARARLAKDKPTLLFESGNLVTEPDCCQPVFRFLESLGYVGYFFCDSRLVPLSDFDPQRHLVGTYGNHNFVFSHPRQVRWDSLERPFALTRLDSAIESSRAA